MYKVTIKHSDKSETEFRRTLVERLAIDAFKQATKKSVRGDVVRLEWESTQDV